MDVNTYDQLYIEEENLGDAKNFVKEGLIINVSFYKGKAIGVEMPNFVDMIVAKTEPGMKGDTAQNATKPAELETGYMTSGAALPRGRRNDQDRHAVRGIHHTGFEIGEECSSRSRGSRGAERQHRSSFSMTTSRVEGDR